MVARAAPTLWLVDLDDPATRARAEAAPLLPADLADLARHRDAGERLLRRRLTRRLLAAAAGCRPDQVAIGRSAEGAPVIDTPLGWHLSVAARWPACLIGVAPVPLGVDIERVGGEPLPNDLLTEGERDRLASLPLAERPRAYAECWAMKEAHAKWTRHPRSLDPASIDTLRHPRDGGDGGVRVTSRLGTTRCWHRDAPDHVAAVCTA